MNATIKAGLAAIQLLAISCTKETIQSLSRTPQSANNSVAAHYIGQHYGGGIIFFIDSTEQHGLIADTADLPKRAPWDPNNVYTTTGAIKKSIGNGYLNTQQIVSALGDSGRYAAFKCWNYKRHGYRDWFLPSKNELNELFKQRNVVGGFASFFYWSSTEIDNSDAWDVDFFDGSNGYGGKGNAFSVRAIRAF